MDVSQYICPTHFQPLYIYIYIYIQLMPHKMWTPRTRGAHMLETLIAYNGCWYNFTLTKSSPKYKNSVLSFK